MQQRSDPSAQTDQDAEPMEEEAGVEVPTKVVTQVILQPNEAMHAAV